MKRFLVVALLCFNIIAFIAIVGYPNAEAIPRQESEYALQNLKYALPQTTPEWERSALKASREVLAEFGKNIKEASKEFQVNWKIIVGVVVTESMGNPYAESPAGAKGCMQTLPSTDEEIGIRGNSFDCPTSIWKGAKYLAHLRDHYKITPPAKVLAAYERGLGRVAHYTQEDLLKSDYINKIAFVVENLPENF